MPSFAASEAPVNGRAHSPSISVTPDWATIRAAIDAALSRPIAFHRVFASVAGGALPGLFLSQLFYWSQRTSDPDGWFYKTGDEWREETALTRCEQETARKMLKKRGLIEEKKAGVPCRLFYRLNREAFYAALLEQAQKTVGGKSTIQFVENQQTGLRKTDKQVGRKPTGQLEDLPPTLTENTQKT